MPLFRVAELINVAIRDEETGIAFYKALAGITKNPEIKERVLGISRQEELHAQWFREMLDEVADGRTGCLSQKTVLDIHLKIDLAETVRKLNRRQKEICSLLQKGLTVTEVSSRRSMPRSTIYDEIGRIREIFQKKGLEDYLE